MDFKFGHSLENGTRLLEGKIIFLQHFIISENNIRNIFSCKLSCGNFFRFVWIFWLIKKLKHLLKHIFVWKLSQNSCNRNILETRSETHLHVEIVIFINSIGKFLGTLSTTFLLSKLSGTQNDGTSAHILYLVVWMNKIVMRTYFMHLDNLAGEIILYQCILWSILCCIIMLNSKFLFLCL